MSNKWNDLTGAVKLLTGHIIQTTISNISDDGKSGIANIEGRSAHVEYFYDTSAIRMVNNKLAITGTGMWYEQTVD
jgi:hypothetical protein